LLGFVSLQAQTLSGKITSEDGCIVEFASVFFSDTGYGTTSNERGEYRLSAPAGDYTLVVKILGYNTFKTSVSLQKTQVLNIVIKPNTHQLDEISVIGKSATRKVNESAYNVVAIDAKILHNSNLDIVHAMAKISGVKIRESGGLGSDLQFSLNGFTGRHIKFFMDGVPMEGMGSSFQINNIPINMAERIEIYKGVVPVELGADAIGGAINIVTNKRNRTFVDASYSYGSFNTHKTVVNAGHTAKNGLMFEVNAFQNYSDNNYHVYTPVEDLTTMGIDKNKIEKVKRFNDTYHNETVILKAGLVNKPFADRLVFSLNLGKSYKDVQTGVRQEIVFGQKHNKTQTIMPSFHYFKRNLFTKGLNVSLTANYNNNIRQNIDTASYYYNWRGESKYTPGKLGEQSYLNSEYENKNWNTTFNTQYRINHFHSFSLNDVFTSFDRNTRATPQDATVIATDTMPKVSKKNILGVSYKLNYNNKWNISVFGKHYAQYAKGPKATDASSSKYELYDETYSTVGYGIAGTYFWMDFQTKLSYEKAYRLPTDDELFGDEDMESGSTGLKAENSDNYNLSLSYDKTINKVHFIYIEGGFMLRNTKDYIKRTLYTATGQKQYASHINHGYVRNIGFNGEVRYSFKNLLSAGVNVTSQNIRDHEKITAEKSTPNINYGVRLPNMPYFFANGNISVFRNNCIGKGHVLTFTYGNNYVQKFPLRWENQGSKDTKDWVPKQFSHDVEITYSMQNGRYNLSLECKNLTDERMYDNFSLQKPGRAFYTKVRYFFNK
jgi:outer membrane receptor protein involved in Fe transport